MILHFLAIAIFGIIGVIVVAFVFYFLAIFLSFLFKPKNIKKEEEISKVVRDSISKDESSDNVIDNDELISVITATICAYTGSSANSFVIRSVQESEEITPIWGMAERFRRFEIK